jgi:hypothetical protein
VDAEQAELLRGILGMAQEEVDALDAEQRAGVLQVRHAATLPGTVIAGLPPAEREELLALRAQLVAALGIVPSP